MTYSTLETLNAIINKMGKKRMAYARFGDGELMVMNGWEGKENNHWGSPKLAQEMKEAFQINDNNYLKALAYNQTNEEGMSTNVFARFPYQDRLKTIINKFEKNTNYKYYHPTALHYQMIFYPNNLMRLIKIIRQRRVMLVAGEHLVNLIEPFNIKYFIPAPTKQAYYNKDLYNKILKSIKNVDIILWGIGIGSKPFIKRVWQGGYNVISLDMGSILDAMAGFKTRSWIFETQPLIKKFNKQFYAI